MKLEQELKSIKPMLPVQRATLNILFTASWLDCFLTRHLRKFHLTNPQYNILRIVNGSAPKGLSLLDIKSRMLDRSSNVSRLVEKLRESKLLERTPNDEDRRAVIVTISEKGRQLLADIEATGMINGPDQPGKKMSEADLTQLAALLDEFRE